MNAVCEPVKERTMNTTTFDSERRALRDLAYSIEMDKKAASRKAHHMDLYRPSTFGEIRKLIKDQKVDLHPDYSEYEDDEEIMEWVSPTSMLTLNYQKPDRKGHKEALNKIDKEFSKLRTYIAVFPPEEAFKKVEAFESKTFH